MNEPRTVVLALWSRLLAGESLGEIERQRLADLLQQDSALRQEIETDANLNALLRFLSDVSQTEDHFVQGVLDRCSAMPERELRKGEAVAMEREVSEVSEKSGSHPSQLESMPSGGPRISVVSKRERTPKKPYSRRRQPSMWMALASTAALFTGLSLVVWSMVGTVPPTAENHSNDSAVQDLAIQGPDTAVAKATDEQRRLTPPLIATNDQQPVPDKDQGDPINAGSETPLSNLPDPEGIAQDPTGKARQHFVTLTKFEDPVWERKNHVGDRLGDEVVRLFAGSVQLTFDDGAVVTVDGPIEFRPMSTGQLELRRGRLLANVPQQAIGFTVSTPTSKIVDLGTEFEVAVNDAGESDVQVLKGEVEVAPIALAGEDARKWRLLPDDFNRASFFAPPQIQGPVPVSASLQGAGGQFHGFVSLNGKTAEFTSSEAFDNIRRRAVTELVRSQDNALLQWGQFVDSMQNNMQGTMKMNGQEVHFGNLQEVMQLQNSLLEKVQRDGKKNESSFSGSININGKVMTFKTREEYESARRAAFGSAATFGIGDVFGVDRPNR